MDGSAEARWRGRALRAGAVALVCLLPTVWAEIVWHMYAPAAVVQGDHGRYTVVAVNGPDAERAGVHRGDQIDARGIDGGEGYRLAFGSISQPVTYPIVRNGRVERITLRDRRVLWPSTWYTALDDVAQGLVGTLFLLAAAVLLFRRPSGVTAAFGLAALGVVPGYPVIELFAAAPTRVFAYIAAAGVTVFGALPQFALLCFAVRFPGTPRSRIGRTALYAADALAVAAVLFYLVDYARAEAMIDGVSVVRDIVPQFGVVALALVVAAIRFSRSSGIDRRRFGWVLVGMVITSAAYFVSNLDQDLVGYGFYLPHWLGPLIMIAYGALPLALVYAVLRHRVIDVGFALNRTLVYSILTATIFVIISTVDWLTGRFISNSNLSIAIEAAVMVSLGVALNWLHGRVETVVDRVVFRKRHLATTRLELRIRALDFARAASTVEQTLVDDVVEVLNLRSAAVFRKSAGGEFARVRAVGWDGAQSQLDAESLLIRALLAEERTLIIGNVGADSAAFPRAAASPDIAIPLVVRHDLIGIVLYGHRDEQGILDPEETALLERLAHAAASAYDAIEAAEWRRIAMRVREGFPAR